MSANNYFKVWTPVGAIEGVFPFDDRDMTATQEAYLDVVACKAASDHAAAEDEPAKPERSERISNRWISVYRRPWFLGPWSALPVVTK